MKKEKKVERNKSWGTVLRAFLSFIIIGCLAFWVIGYKRIVAYELHRNPILMVASGDGTEEKPFLIANEKQFISFRDSVNRGYFYDDCYFQQTSDLDLTEEDNWIPIGLADTSFYFGGYYDGGGYRIRGVSCVNSGATDSASLFGQISGTVMNLGIEESSFQGENAASIVYASKGSEAKIINCYSTADVSAQSSASGIAHNFAGYIVNCWYGGFFMGERTAAISTENPICIYSCFGYVPLFTDSFSGHISMTETEIVNTKDAFQKTEESILDCARFMKMDPNDFAIWE